MRPSTSGSHGRGRRARHRERAAGVAVRGGLLRRLLPRPGRHEARGPLRPAQAASANAGSPASSARKASDSSSCRLRARPRARAPRRRHAPRATRRPRRPARARPASRAARRSRRARRRAAGSRAAARRCRSSGSPSAGTRRRSEPGLSIRAVQAVELAAEAERDRRAGVAAALADPEAQMLALADERRVDRLAARHEQRHVRVAEPERRQPLELASRARA